MSRRAKSVCLGGYRIHSWVTSSKNDNFVCKENILHFVWECREEKKGLYFSNDKEEKVFITTLLQIFFYYYSNKVCSKIKLIPFQMNSASLSNLHSFSMNDTHDYSLLQENTMRHNSESLHVPVLYRR